jgi:hypothetical protein
MAAPIATGAVSQWSKPSQAGSHCTCSTPMIMPTTPRIAPTDRSMLRVTMTSTMPVDMTAMEAV